MEAEGVAELCIESCFQAGGLCSVSFWSVLLLFEVGWVKPFKYWFFCGHERTIFGSPCRAVERWLFPDHEFRYCGDDVESTSVGM